MGQVWGKVNSNSVPSQLLIFFTTLGGHLQRGLRESPSEVWMLFAKLMVLSKQDQRLGITMNYIVPTWSPVCSARCESYLTLSYFLLWGYWKERSTCPDEGWRWNILERIFFISIEPVTEVTLWIDQGFLGYMRLWENQLVLPCSCFSG